MSEHLTQRLTGAGRAGGRTISGLPADVTTSPDEKAFAAGLSPGGGFGAARRTAGAGRQVQASGAASGAGNFSGLSGLSFNIGV